jgi:hypothetical protein
MVERENEELVLGVGCSKRKALTAPLVDLR